MAGEAPRKIPVVFYRTRGGAELVRDWLRSLDDRDRNAIGLDLMRVQFRWPIGMPLCRAMGDGGRIVVLHGFIKKTRKTPDEELTLARKRMREFEA
jgi:phage-related protein